MKSQEALRVVVFLMSHGADARAVNNVRETPLDVAARLTSGFPKARKLFISILDSSKYEVTGGTIFIVPGKPQLTRVEEEDVVNEAPDPQAAVRAGGINFSPSRRNRRARKTEEIANSQRPHPMARSGPYSGRARPRNVAALPRGDHETAVGGTNHHLAAEFSSHQYVSREAFRCASTEKTMPLTSGDARSPFGGGRQTLPGQTIGIMFKDSRMARNSAVFYSGSKRRRPRTPFDSRPATCSVPNNKSQSGNSGFVRPTTIGLGTLSRAEALVPTEGYHAGSSKAWIGNRQQAHQQRHAVDWKRGKKNAATTIQREGDPSVPDFEARRQISEWLRKSAGTVVAVPPTAGSTLGGHLVETSAFVATDDRSEVYKALRAIKDQSRGELISAEKLRCMLCRTGQPLKPAEMDELLLEADPGDTGCVFFLSTVHVFCLPSNPVNLFPW